MKISGHICTVSVYEYQGWRFEYKPYIGAWPLCKDSDEPFRRVSARSKFWGVISDFLDLPEDEQRSYKISGGCIPI